MRCTSSTPASAATYQEELPGRIIQTGLMAAIASRLFLGQLIDRFGVRAVWIGLTVSTLCGSTIFAIVETVSPLLYVGRVLYAIGISGMFTCSMFHVQVCVAEHRRTEFLGLLGSSGFVGMICGTQLVDLLSWLNAGDRIYFRYTFFAVMLCNAGYIVLACLATKGFPRPKREIRPTLLRMMQTYWPGPIVFVGMAMGLIFAVPSLYLVRFTTYAGLGGIAGFWTSYAVTALVVRVGTARLSQKVGRYRLITFGMFGLGTGLLCIIPATQPWHLVAAAVICGLGHAMLFPSIVSLGSERFPPKYRGSGTNLALLFVDLGTGLSAPILGRIIDMEMFGRAGYPQMFFTAGITPIILALAWQAWYWGRVDSEIQKS